MAEGLGQLISGKYRLLSVLGEGAMGVVYRAEQLDAEGQPLREVALKMVQPTFSRDPDFARRFLREVRIAARLRSPHTVTVYDTGQSEAGHLYYAMELVQGPTLKELLQRYGSLPVERVVRIVGQVCEALAEAHSLPEPVVHRDLKPANIFVETRQGKEWAKVGDFGIAKVVGEHTSGLTHTGASPGTPRYMAPEQWMGKEVDGRADLYALGIMLYEMLTGKAPFSGGEGPLALMYQHLHEPPPLLPPSLPAGVCLQVERLLVKAPQGRPADALGVRRALAAALAEDGERSTILLEERKRATLAETDVVPETGRAPVEVKQETLALEALAQPATVVQPGAVATRGRAREAALWRYGAAGSLIVLALLIGGQWYRSRQLAEKAPQPSTEAEPRGPGLELVTVQFFNAAEDGKRLSQPAESFAASQLRFVAYEAVFRTRLRDLAPAYHRVEAIYYAPNGQPLGTVQDGKEVAAESGEVTFTGRLGNASGGAFVPGNYRVEFSVNGERLSSKEFTVEDDKETGWYKTTSRTPILKEPRKDATVIKNLSPNTKVNVVGAVGDYLKVQSRKGNAPGYIVRKDVAPVQWGKEAPGQAENAPPRGRPAAVLAQAQEEARKQEEAARQAAMRHEEEERRQREEQERIWRFYKDVMPRLFR